MPRKHEQLVPAFPKGRGGRREGAGRKPSPERQGFVVHRTRPVHAAREPAHITMRTVKLAPNLRAELMFRVVRQCLSQAVARRIHVIHFSVQTNHLHLLVEARDRVRLARDMQWLAARIARALNVTLGRAGRLWRDRYHRHDLTSPREVRNALVYVLRNVAKHRDRANARARLDPCTSVPWFEGWDPADPRAGPELARVRTHTLMSDLPTPSPVCTPKTWLAAVGWKRGGGPLRFDELPIPRP